VQRPMTSGPRGCPASQTPRPVRPTLQPLVGWLRGDTLQEAVEGNPKMKVGGGRTPWPADHHLAFYGLNQVGNPSLHPYKYPLPMEIKATHSTSSSPLVKVQFSSCSVGKALSGVES
jgi:hypothetical protein